VERVGLVMVSLFKSILSDKGHIKRNTIIQIIIATIAFIILVRIYPFAVVESHKTSKQQAFNYKALKELSGDEFTTNDKKLQTVYFTNDHLYRVKLYMTASFPEKVSRAQYVTFRIYDENFSCISSEDVSLFKIEKKGFLKATPDIDVEIGKPYYYEILVPEECEAYIELPTASKESINQEENSTLYIDGVINDELCLVADFDYSAPLTIAGIILRYIIVIAIALLTYVGLVYLIDYFESRFADHSDIIINTAKIALSILLVLAGSYVIVNSVILNKFGSPIYDRVIYFIAVLVGLFWSLGAMWIVKYYPKVRRDYARVLIWKNYIQTVSFGLLFYALCQYVNADRNFYHYTNTRWMLIFLAIAFLMLLNGSVIINKFSAAWLIVGWICSAIYCHTFKGDEREFLLARLTCGVIVAWGLFILNLIISFIRQGNIHKISLIGVKAYIGWHKLQTIYMVLWVLFAILMYKYRYEKVWVFTATLPFASLAFIKLTPQIKSRLLRNLSNGIILSFGLVTLFCLIHRPHYYWMLYRYGGIFHTVACTGMYLAIVFAAVLGKLYGHLKAWKGMFLRCYCDFLLIGCVVGFIILTMSRTAFVTIAVSTISVSALAAVTYKKKFKRIAQEFGLILVNVVVCFPLVFSAVRMIPSIINDPVIYDLEYHDEDWIISVGEPIYSTDYMTVERFFTVLLGRFEKTADSEEEASIYIKSESLLASTGSSFEVSYDTDEDETLEDENDISNGRFKIFGEYIKAIGFKGHSNMSIEEDGVEKYDHAHNSYLQIFYNFGIIAGVVFLAIYAISVWRSASIAISQGRKYTIYFVPFALIVAFGIISLTEWVFHPCIPAGFCFLLMQPILIKEA
jgi:hypothetical protein